MAFELPILLLIALQLAPRNETVVIGVDLVEYLLHLGAIEAGRVATVGSSTQSRWCREV